MKVSFSLLLLVFGAIVAAVSARNLGAADYRSLFESMNQTISADKNNHPVGREETTSEASFQWWQILIIFLGAEALFVSFILVCAYIWLKQEQLRQQSLPQQPPKYDVTAEEKPTQKLSNEVKTAEKPNKKMNEAFPPAKEAKLLPEYEIYQNPESEPHFPTELMTVSLQKFIPKSSWKRHTDKLIAQMNKDYPPKMMKYGWDEKLEYSTLCCSLNEMCVTISALSYRALDDLKYFKVVFDQFDRIKEPINKKARAYLKGPSCPSYVVYFAFGAEYHQFLPFIEKDLAKCSVPLLFVVALQHFHSDGTQKKACELLRKELPSIRQSYPRDVRETLPYPIPMIEAAFQKAPEYFKDPSKSDDSEQHQKKVYAAKTRPSKSVGS